MSLLKYISELKDKSLSEIRTDVHKKGILSSYNDDGRMIFYTSKNSRFLKFADNTQQNMWLECNGLVLDVKNMKPLVIPPPSYVSNIDSYQVNDFIKEDLYDIYHIEDGTIISLYYWGGKWNISTARGYNMSDVKWGKLTYEEVLKDVLELYRIQLYKFYESLDKNRCYTFGFKHESMHPFKGGATDPINKMWFVQSVELSTGSISNKLDPKIGIPNQKKYTFPADKQKNTKTLFHTVCRCLEYYLQSGVVNYGFILRSKDPDKTGLYTHIILESSLLQKIRQLYYNINLSTRARELNYDREIYTVIYSYLNPNIGMLFINLFPQYTHMYQKLNGITNYLVNSILGHANGNHNEAENHSGVLYDQLKLRCYVNPKNRYMPNIISSFFINSEHVSTYYDMYINQDKSRTAHLNIV